MAVPLMVGILASQWIEMIPSWKWLEMLLWNPLSVPRVLPPPCRSERNSEK